jgi:hypothetical protein
VPDRLDLKRVWPLQPLLADAIQRTLDTGKEILNLELTLEGPTHVLLSTQVHQQSDQDARIVALLHDITEYKKMEELIRKRAGLAEAGEMIAAIMKSGTYCSLLSIRFESCGGPDLSRMKRNAPWRLWQIV